MRDQFSSLVGSEAVQRLTADDLFKRPDRERDSDVPAVELIPKGGPDCITSRAVKLRMPHPDPQLVSDG